MNPRENQRYHEVRELGVVMVSRQHFCAIIYSEFGSSLASEGLAPRKRYG